MTAGKFWFAWVGGVTDPPLTLNTTGDVFSDSFSTLGDTCLLSTRVNLHTFNESVGECLNNFASDAGLIVGHVYRVEGSGIRTGAEFIYGGLGSPSVIVQLLGPDARFISKHAVAVEVRIFEGSNNTIYRLRNTSSLLVGHTYSISGSGIPAGTTFVYSGGIDIFLSQQLLLQGTDVSLTITSTDVDDAKTVRNLASTDGLEIGIEYEIFGLGIVFGSTFIYGGGNSVVISNSMTRTQTGVAITISKDSTQSDGGPFDPLTMAREDEKIFASELEQNEGDFATLKIDIENPRIGLLAAGRPIWCWFSFTASNGEIIPLFHGRLIGIPEDLENEVVRLQFVAMPDDYHLQKVTLAETLKTPPFWDVVWLAEKESDPDTVLEARTELWHIDRETLTLSTSDILIGEDGTLTINEHDHFYDSMKVTFGQPPLRRVSVTGEVRWNQHASGTLDITPEMVIAFQAGGSPVVYPLVSSLTGDGLLSTWPAPGTSIGAGWSIAADSSIVTATWIKPVAHAVIYIKDAQVGADRNFFGVDLFRQFRSGFTRWSVVFDLGIYDIFFNLDYTASRNRTETVSFILEADVQPIIVQAGAKEEERIDLKSDYVGQPIDPGLEFPIGDFRRNTYFKTDRGKRSFEYLLMLARAKLLLRARAVQVSVAMSYEKGVLLSCRKSAVVFDNRLPGGQATGKIISYKLAAAGDGAMVAEATIGCSVGYGRSVHTNPGKDTYADDYSEGYDAVTGGTDSTGIGDVTYESFDDFDVIDDDGLNLFDMRAATCVRSIVVTDGPDKQVAAVDAVKNSKIDPVSVLKDHPTVVDLDLVPIATRSFQTDFSPFVSKLMVPKTVDLEHA